MPLLSLAIWVPIAAALLVLAAGGDRHAPLQRAIALVGALAGFLVTIPLYTGFDAAQAGMQFVELAPWIPRFAVNYHLGVDGISMLFLLLNSFITVLVVIAGWTVIESRVGQYYASFLMLSGFMNGVFAALDGVLFYVFFEATLIPMFIIIGVWGGPNRVYAAVKFFLYTLHGMAQPPFWLALAGIATAWVLYMKRTDLPKKIAMAFGPVYALVERKYGFDELYSWLFAQGARVVGTGLWKGGDQRVIDGVMVNGSARLVGWFSALASLLQSGMLYRYAGMMLLGVVLATYWFLRI